MYKKKTQTIKTQIKILSSQTTIKMETENPTLQRQLADCYHDEIVQMMLERDMPSDDHSQTGGSI
jgi:hypothetical protein